MTYVKITTQAEFKEALDNGYALREFVDGKYPGLSQAWVDPNYQTPRNQPKPVSVPTPPPVAAGFTRSLDATFATAGIDWSIFGNPAYQGAPGGTHAMDLSSHTTQPGDGLLHLKFYADAVGTDPSDNDNAGAGIQTTQAKLWPVGSTMYVGMRVVNPNPVVVPMGLLMGQNWQEEIDFFEGGQAHVHWDGNQEGFNEPSNDPTIWHVWGIQWGKTEIEFTLDGKVWATTPNPSTNANDTAGDLSPMFLSVQIEDGDPSYTSAPIPASDAVDYQIAFIVVDVPA